MSNQVNKQHNYSSAIVFLLIGIGSFVINGLDFILFTNIMFFIGLTGIITEFFFHAEDPKDERMKSIGYKSGFFAHHATNSCIIILSLMSALEYITSLTFVLLTLMAVSSLSFIVPLSINAIKN